MKHPPIAREKQLPHFTLFISYRGVYSYDRFLRDHGREPGIGYLKKEHWGHYRDTRSCWSGKDISDILLASTSIDHLYPGSWLGTYPLCQDSRRNFQSAEHWNQLWSRPAQLQVWFPCPPHPLNPWSSFNPLPGFTPLPFSTRGPPSLNYLYPSTSLSSWVPFLL